MIIRNQVLLKQPWLWPVCTLTGSAYIFVEDSGLSAMAKLAIYFGTVCVSNIWFFSSLRQTQRNRTPDPPPGDKISA